MAAIPAKPLGQASMSGEVDDRRFAGMLTLASAPARGGMRATHSWWPLKQPVPRAVQPSSPTWFPRPALRWSRSPAAHFLERLLQPGARRAYRLAPRQLPVPGGLRLCSLLGRAAFGLVSLPVAQPAVDRVVHGHLLLKQRSVAIEALRLRQDSAIIHFCLPLAEPSPSPSPQPKLRPRPSPTRLA